MADPTQAEVRVAGGFPNNAVTNAVIDAALAVAINQYNELKAASSVTVSTLTEHDVKLYLACHYTHLGVNQGALTSNKLGEAREDYANIYEAGLYSTRFGQMAAALDPTGKLAEVAKKSADPKLPALFAHIEPAPFDDDEEAGIV